MSDPSSAPRHAGEIFRLVRAWDLEALTDAELYKAMAWAVAGLALALGVFFMFFNPGPPKVIVMSTGAPSGAYHAYAQKYKALLKPHGITLEIVESSGSLQNIERVRTGEMVEVRGRRLPVTAAFVQSGVHEPAAQDAVSIESLSSVAYEPLWFFLRPGLDAALVSELRGKRLAVGMAGSGANVAARRVLDKSGVGSANSTLLDVGGSEAVQAVQSGAADVAVLVAAPQAQAVAQAFEAGLQLMTFAQADGYLRNFSWLRKVVIPRGAVDLSKDLPKRDVTLIAATANLVVHADLHRALAFLLMDVASEVHAPASITQNLREFPSQEALEFTQSSESQRYFKTGRPFLQTYLPFWLANWVERIMTSFVPILLLAVPLIKLIPGFMGWRESAHVSRLYLSMKNIEADLKSQRIDAPAATTAFDRMAEVLRQMESHSNQLSQIYSARDHLRSTRAALNV
jgi:TRAP-type uncharacterized transport system substrate-binding protein